MRNDERWMREAIEEAQKGVGHTAPNPAVGAVIVKGDKLVGRGWHRKAGGPHAEREAIADVRARFSTEESADWLIGATIYVTLEPCSTQGRTPPCTQGILDAGISRVVYGAEDPNPAHAGAAKQLLVSAGLDVRSGVCVEECEDLIRGFSKVQRTGLPWVLVKSGMSLDGKITRPAGEGQWLTGEASRKVVQRLRFESDAVITGGNTLRADDPALTVRDEGLLGGVDGYKQPWRMVVTRGKRGSLPAAAQLFTDEFAQRTEVQEDGDLEAGLRRLVDLGCHTVMVEAGGRLLAAFFEAGLVDELVFFYAPLLAGGPDWGVGPLSQDVELRHPEFSQVGDDVMLRARL